MQIYRRHEPGTRLGFSHTKPVHVADDLSELRGPASGTVTLPIHIDWTPAATYDLAVPERVRTMLETVLREADSEAEVAEWIDRDLLVEHWVALNPEPFIREAWESAHPELRGVPHSPSFVVADTLDELRGPATGEVTLPNRLLWNRSRPFDLADDERLQSMMRIVLREARSQEDLARFVDRGSLIRLWSTLGLPAHIRAAWEAAHPELRRPRT